MLKILSRFLLLLLFLPPAQALTETITIPGTVVSFKAPDGFTPLTKEQIARKWSRAVPPAFAVGNAGRTTTIAYNMSSQPVADNELEAKLPAFEKLFDRVIPGIVWKKKEISVIGGRRWLHLEMTSNAVDTDIYNIVLGTTHEGKLVLLNFNSTKEDFPKLEASLRKAIGTVSIAQK